MKVCNWYSDKEINSSGLRFLLMYSRKSGNTLTLRKVLAPILGLSGLNNRVDKKEGFVLNWRFIELEKYNITYL